MYMERPFFWTKTKVGIHTPKPNNPLSAWKRPNFCRGRHRDRGHAWGLEVFDYVQHIIYNYTQINYFNLQNIF